MIAIGIVRVGLADINVSVGVFIFKPVVQPIVVRVRDERIRRARGIRVGLKSLGIRGRRFLGLRESFLQAVAEAVVVGVKWIFYSEFP